MINAALMRIDTRDPEDRGRRSRPHLLKLTQLPIWMSIVIEEMKGKYSSWSTPRGARDECTFASALFIKRLHKRFPEHMEGVQSGVQEITHHRFYEHHCGREGGGHDVARVGQIIVDWTARQFNPQMAWPRIWREKLPEHLRYTLRNEPARAFEFEDE